MSEHNDPLRQRLRNIVSDQHLSWDDISDAARDAVLDELAKRMVRLSVTKYPSPALKEPWLPLEEVQKVIQEMKQ